MILPNKIDTVLDVYHFVRVLSAECKTNGATDVYEELDDALHLGSSGLEILNALRAVLLRNRAIVEQLLGTVGSEQAREIVHFVDRALGAPSNLA
jgi:hypothetical protein